MPVVLVRKLFCDVFFLRVVGVVGHRGITIVLTKRAKLNGRNGAKFTAFSCCADLR